MAGDGRYERRLRELFDSAAVDGRLDRDGLRGLWATLQLPQAYVDRLLPPGAAPIEFAQFRERLLALLAAEPAFGGASDSPRPRLRRCASFPDSTRASRDESVVDALEAAGVGDARRLLDEFGVAADAFETDAATLADALEKRADAACPSPWRAIAALRKRDADAARALSEAVRGERDKLRADLVEANRRADSLAADVDDTHSRLEADARSRERRLERERSDAARAFESRLEEERERFAATIRTLEQRIATLERDDSRRRAQLERFERDEQRLEADRSRLADRATRVADENARLLETIEALTSRLATERERVDCASSLDERIERLHRDNAALEDRNDELCAEIDRLRGNARAAPGDSPCSNGVKRRNDSLSPHRVEQSPRISKLRKCTDVDENRSPNSTAALSYREHEIDSNAHVPANRVPNDERFIVTSAVSTRIIDYFKDKNCDGFSSLLKRNEYKPYYFVFCRTLSAIMNDIKNGYSFEKYDSDQLENVKRELQSCVREIIDIDIELFLNTVFEGIFKNEASMCSVLKLEPSCIDFYDENGDINIHIKNLNEDLLQERLNRKEDNARNGEKIEQLERNLESLRNMYEECEEYWTQKLKEERDIFDQEQQINDEKFNDLMDKLAEYEEQFAHNDSKNGFRTLSTIDEKCNLEKQFNDLEDEFQAYKIKTEREISEKNDEINLLKTKTNLNNSCILNECVHTYETDQSPNKMFNELNESNTVDSLNNCNVTDSSSPCNDYLWNRKNLSLSASNNKVSSDDKIRDYQNPIFSKDQTSKHESDGSIKTSIKTQDMSETADTVSYNILLSQDPESIKAENYHNIDNSYAKRIDKKLESRMLQCSELEETLQGRKKECSNLGVIQSEVNNTFVNDRNGIINQDNAILRATILEIRCRQLQMNLRQQQMYTENVMQQTLAAHRSEIGALRQKLAAADLLVRDLYVENCHLTESIINYSI